jgi:hypothetical protein
MKTLNFNSIEIENIDFNDAHDFVDAFISYAEFTDGTPLTDEELEQIDDSVRYDAIIRAIY